MSFYLAGCVLLFATHCFLVCSICRCLPGSCLLVLKGYQFTHMRNFIFQFKMVAGCCWLSLNVVSMIQAVCVTLAAGCWCLRVTTLHKFFNFILWDWLPVFVWHLLFYMAQAVCVTRAAVCWCLGTISLHEIPFSSFMWSGWMLASVCHSLFSLWLNLFLPSWKLSAGA